VHEAVAYEEHPRYGEGQIASVYRPGYRLHERVLRPAQVVVARASSVASAPMATDELDTLRDVARERDITVLSSLHQIDLATRFADRVLGLRAGRLVVDKPAEAFDDTDYGLIFASPTPVPPSGTPA